MTTPIVCLKGDVAEITDAMRRENHKIDFFEQRNPEWRRGTELPCVGVFDGIPSENMLYVLPLSP